MGPKPKASKDLKQKRRTNKGSQTDDKSFTRDENKPTTSNKSSSQFKNLQVRRKKGARQQKAIVKYTQMQHHGNELLMSRFAFTRSVREIMQDLYPKDLELRFRKYALLVLQEAAEMYLTEVFEESYSSARNANRDILKRCDLMLYKSMHGFDEI